ncbi:MAG: high-potential iron-sulfur protein [Thiobacillus sp.]
MNWKILNRRRMPSASETHALADALPMAETDRLSRRTILRGALAAGCSLLVPAALMGCSKKEAGTASTEPGTSEPGTSGMAAPSAPAPMESPSPSGQAPMESASPPSQSSMESAAPAAPAKLSKASVQYQTEPKGDQSCANCLHFVAESNTCKLVEGDISPNGWCAIWTKKV